MNIGNSVYWHVNIIVGAKVGRGNNSGVDSDIDTNVVNVDDEGVELKVLYEVSSGYGSSVDIVYKCVKKVWGVGYEVGSNIGD